MGVIDHRFADNIITTNLDTVLAWARKNSLWPMGFGLACCAIEMIAAGGPDSTSPGSGPRCSGVARQADLMIVAGTVTKKMAPVLRRLYDQMPEPKWVISMGSCSNAGGPFPTYSVLQGVDKVVPVDVYISGCPPRPEALFYGLMRLQDKISRENTVFRKERWIPAAGPNRLLSRTAADAEGLPALVLPGGSRQGSLGHVEVTRRSRPSRSSTPPSVGPWRRVSGACSGCRSSPTPAPRSALSATSAPRRARTNLISLAVIASRA